MHGQRQPEEMDNTAGSNKRSAAAAKCQAISLDDNGTETSHKSRVWLHSAASITLPVIWTLHYCVNLRVLVHDSMTHQLRLCTKLK